MKSLENIAQRLIVNGTLTEQPGLFYGKIGIAIFFFHYARFTGNELFEDYAMDLIEEVQKQMNTTKIPLRYDIGLSGIGAGYEYMLQNGFLEVEDSDIFNEFDDRMYRAAMYEWYPNLNLPEGLTGWGRYFIYRIQGNGQRNAKLHEALIHIVQEMAQKIVENKVLESEQLDAYRFLHDVTSLPGFTDRYSKIIQKCREWKCVNKPDTQKAFPYMGNLQRLYTCQKYFNMDLSKEIGQEWKKWEDMGNLFSIDMGLLKGLTAEAMLHWSFVNQQNTTWINLL